MGSSTQTYNHRFEVFSIAFALLFLESIFFKTALYIHDFVNALMVISYALLGLGIGSILSSFFHELKPKSIFLLKLMMFLCVILSFVNFVAFPSYIFFSPFLVLPFIAGNSLISYFLQKRNSHTIYFVDLTGATLGFFMGIPFPYGLESVKKEFSGSSVAFFFALNCVFSTFAVFFSFYFSVNHGFSMTFGCGITCYFLSMVLLYFSRLKG